MKKFFWPVACIFFIAIVLFSRTFFLNRAPSVDHNNFEINTGSSLPEITNPDLPQMSNKLVFPPQNSTLVMPAFTYPPFTMQNQAGKWIGADNEIIENVLLRMGYQVQWIEMPFARALEEMKSGKYPAMTACVEGDDREEYILFSEPVSSIYSVLWKMQSNPFCWQTYDDLQGLLIGASNYHYGAGFFEAAKEGKFALDMVANKKPEIIHFRKLREGKIDMFICELSLGSYLKQRFKPEFNDVVPCQTGVGPPRPFSFAISRKYFDGREEQMQKFVTAFNNELLDFSMEGHRQTIFEKYQMSIALDNDGMIRNTVNP